MAVTPRRCEVCGEEFSEPGMASYCRAEDGTLKLTCSDCVIAGRVIALDDGRELGDGPRGSGARLAPLHGPHSVMAAIMDAQTFPGPFPPHYYC